MQVRGSRPTPGLTLQVYLFKILQNKFKKNKKIPIKEYRSQNIFLIFYSLFRI
jgi:hypothetical protein